MKTDSFIEYIYFPDVTQLYSCITPLCGLSSRIFFSIAEGTEKLLIQGLHLFLDNTYTVINH